MKLSTVITIITTALAASVSVAAETNAERFARGLPPLPPMKRATNVRYARNNPSALPNPCHHDEKVQCCKSIYNRDSKDAKKLAGLLNFNLKEFDGKVGEDCKDWKGSKQCKHIYCCKKTVSKHGVTETGACGCRPLKEHRH